MAHLASQNHSYGNRTNNFVENFNKQLKKCIPKCGSFSNFIKGFFTALNVKTSNILSQYCKYFHKIPISIRL